MSRYHNWPCVLLGLLGLSISNAADYPQWWIDREVATAQPPSSGSPEYNEWDEGNRSVLLQGQLYFVLDQAIQELDLQLDLIGGSGLSLLSLRDENKAAAYTSPVLLGQLKYLSAPIFDLFEQIGFEPGQPGWPSGMILNDLSASPADSAITYPWLSNAEDQYEVSLIGQLRFLFSWDVQPWLSVDSENSGAGDGLPDWWEHYYFSSETLYAGLDDSESTPDGISNTVEYLIGSSPDKPASSSSSPTVSVFRPN